MGPSLSQRLLRPTARPRRFFLPLQGVSVLDSPSGEFWQPAADQARDAAIKAHARGDIPVHQVDCNINDAAIAQAVVDQLLAFLGKQAVK